MTNPPPVHGPDWFTAPPRRRMGVHAVITRGTRILLVTKPYRAGDSAWSLPGGSAAPGEAPSDALPRILSARLGLTATTGDLLAFDSVPARENEHYEGLNFVYAVRLPGGAEPVVTANGRLGEARWVERAALGEHAAGHPLRRIGASLAARDHGHAAELYHGVPRTR
ncbi:NUDIX domain-containing protein [Streptomyces sp. NPDC004610]|uniref:NUDIX domain-containing protein n=1 Tax=unclassified Streptomyces TaxID=2593676 RepID=UPI0033A9720B